MISRSTDWERVLSIFFPKWDFFSNTGIFPELNIHFKNGVTLPALTEPKRHFWMGLINVSGNSHHFCTNIIVQATQSIIEANQEPSTNTTIDMESLPEFDILKKIAERRLQHLDYFGEYRISITDRNSTQTLAQSHTLTRSRG